MSEVTDVLLRLAGVIGAGVLIVLLLYVLACVAVCGFKKLREEWKK